MPERSFGRPLMLPLRYRRLLLGMGLAAACAAPVTGAAPRPAEEVPEAVPGELVVRYRGDTAPFRVLRGLSAASTGGVLRALRGRKDVLSAAPNWLYRLQAVPNDPAYANQWNFREAPGAARIALAWDFLQSRGREPGAGAVVGVIDTGVAYETYLDTFEPARPRQFVQAPDFAQTEIRFPRDVLRGTDHANDSVNHGTHIAGTIAAGVNDGVGAAGIAPRAALIPVKAARLTPSGAVALPDSAIADGIRWLADHDAQIINMSFGGPVPSEIVADAITYAREKGCLLVASVGNTGSRNTLWPGNYDAEVMSIAGGMYTGQRAFYSAYGAGVSLTAPGGSIWTDFDDDLYGDGIIQQTFLYLGNPASFVNADQQGTSMAAAHVSGVAALVAGMGVPPHQIRGLLQATARRTGRKPYNEQQGWGLLDARAAVEAAEGEERTSSQLRVEAVQLMPRQEGEGFTGEARVRISDEYFQAQAGATVRLQFASGKQRATRTAITDASGVATARGLQLNNRAARRLSVRVLGVQKSGYRFARPLSAELTETADLPRDQ